MFDATQPAYLQLCKIYAEQTSQLVAWTGAGLSASAGLPSWPKLRGLLCDAAYSTARNQDEVARKKTNNYADLASGETDLWLAFEHLKTALGNTSFRAEIKAALTPSETSTVPKAYCLLWELGFRGIVNLNLDGFATRASSEVFHGKKRVIEFSGQGATSYSQAIFGGANPFVVNLHGVVEDEQSWVFTKEQFHNLFRTRGLADFISTLAQSRSLIFAGISADDVGAGGHLQRLLDQGIRFQNHFWITHRSDRATIDWAEDAGLRIIYYTAVNNDHSQLIQALEGLREFVSRDTKPAPVIPPLAYAAGALPPPEIIESKTPEEIRLQLNSAALEILQSGTPDAFQKYQIFCDNYSEAIYRAWSINTGVRNKSLFGYQIEKEHGKGAFGRVYTARDREGNKVAIKVLHVDIRENKKMLDSFRRGVHAMQILEQHGIEGMVPYKQAWEIPSCTVMQFIDGPTLEEAVNGGYISDWHTIIHIGLRLSRIIRDAHLLPERVLHRDIRPANVMLRDYWANPGNLDVVVLDFDLSWHRDAVGNSIDWSQSVSGYIAPELASEDSNASTRSALVDSFGIGMTLFFLASGQKPQFLQQKHAEWHNVLKKAILPRKCDLWKSLPRRYGRLIEYATRDKQSERWDMTRINSELARLQKAMKAPNLVSSAELLAEEIASRCPLVCDSYSWDIDKNEAHAVLSSSKADIRFVGNETTQRVEFRINWSSSGFDSYKSIAKYVQKARDQGYAALKKAGWRVEAMKADVRDAGVEASYHIRDLSDRISEAADAANFVVKLFQFQ